jgi:hypothetical protein
MNNPLQWFLVLLLSVLVIIVARMPSKVRVAGESISAQLKVIHELVNSKMSAALMEIAYLKSRIASLLPEDLEAQQEARDAGFNLCRNTTLVEAAKPMLKAKG